MNNTSWKTNKYGGRYKPGQRTSNQKIEEIRYWWDELEGDMEKVIGKTQVTEKTIKKYVQNRGDLPKRGRQRWSGSKKTFAVVALIIGVLLVFPTMYLREVSKYVNRTLEVNISVPLISQILKEFKFSKKKTVLYAYYRGLPRVQQARFEFRCNIREHHPEHLVFVDEMNCNYKDLCRVFGYSEIGKRCHTKFHRLQRKSFSLIAAISFHHGFFHIDV